MTSFALIFLLFARVFVPFTLLISVGEWVRRREIRYWLPK